MWFSHYRTHYASVPNTVLVIISLSQFACFCHLSQIYVNGTLNGTCCAGACWVILHAFLLSADFFKINVYEIFFREYHLSVKWFGSIIGSTFCHKTHTTRQTKIIFQSLTLADPLGTTVSRKSDWLQRIITEVIRALHVRIKKVLSEGIQLWHLFFLVDEGRPL